MKTTLKKADLLALIFVGTAAFAGCSAFESPSAEYVKPGELCTDVSDLPDPNEPAHDQTVALRNIASQYGAGGGRREESPERLLLQADSYFEQKRYHDSARLYKKYLATGDATTAAPDLLGTIHYRIGFVANKKTFYSEAKGEFAQALQFSPTSNEYLFAYAKACYDSGDFQTADQQFSTLLMRAPAYPEAQRYYGLTLLEGSNRDAALQPLVASVGALEAYTLMTDKYYEVGELEKASQMEAQTIQLAAQSAQPIPRFPHKERLMANAQNATYAQALNNIAAGQLAAAPQVPATQAAAPAIGPAMPAPAAQPVATQFAAVTPIAPQPVVEPTAAPQNATVAQQYAQAAPVLEPEAPIAAQSVPAPQYSQAVPTVEQSAPVVEPTTSAPVAPPVDPIASEYEQVAPLAPEANAIQAAPQAPSQYAQIAPAPVDAPAAVAPQTQGPAYSVPAPVQGPEFNYEIPEEFPAADDEEIWDDSAFATSGSASAGYLADPNAQYQAPQTELPMPAAQPYSIPEYQPQAPVDQYQRPQSFYQDPSFSTLDPEEAFELAAARFDALEAVERLADEAPAIAAMERKNVQYELVGYLSSSTLRGGVRQTSAVEEAPTTATIQPLEQEEAVEAEDVRELPPQGMVATELPPTAPKAEVRFSESVESVKTENVEQPKKRSTKTSVKVGSGNPGLFVATAAKRTEPTSLFRPGSIEEEQDLDQSRPDAIAADIFQRAKRRATKEDPVVVAQKREEEWTRLTSVADALVDGHRFVDSNALVYYEPIEIEEEEYELDEDAIWDDSAFATSGAPEKPEPANAGGFGDYQLPEEHEYAAAPQVAPQVAPQQVPQQIPAQQYAAMQQAPQQIPAQQYAAMQQVPQQIPAQQYAAMQQVPQQIPAQQYAAMQQVPQQVPAQQYAAMQQVPQQIPAQQYAAMQQVPQQIPAQQYAAMQQAPQQIPAQQYAAMQQAPQQTPVQQYAAMQQVPQQIPAQQYAAMPQAQRQAPAPQYVAMNQPQQAPVQQSVQRRQMTPEERLEAARRAGAEIVELSPEQYRHAVTTGLGQQPR